MEKMDLESSSSQSSPINTYHCLCSTLLLATTHTLSSLPTRAPPSQDEAIILPLPPLTHPTDSDLGSDSLRRTGFSSLANVAKDRKSIIVRREDGFEKRAMLKCGRCKLVVGYRIDGSQFGGSGVDAEDVVYLLPGAMISTSDMKAGVMPDVPGWAKEKT